MICSSFFSWCDSSTITSKNESAEVFPAASVAEHVTVVVPIGNVSPEAASQSGITSPSTSSVAETSKSTVVPLGSLVITVVSLGTITVGGVVSVPVDVIVMEAVAMLLVAEPSVA